MADNYLERRFEEYRNGAAPQSKRAAKPAKVRKVCVVGVQSPLGLAVVRSLRVAGHNVVFCGPESEASLALAGSTGTSFTAVDVADAEALFQYVGGQNARWGSIDAVVVMADAHASDFDGEMSVAVRPLYGVAEQLLHLRECEPMPFGRLIAISSLSDASDALQCMSEGAVEALCKGVAPKLSAVGVNVNMLKVGVNADAVPRVCRFLISDDAQSLVGQVINVG